MQTLRKSYWNVLYAVMTMGALVLAAGAPGEWGGP